MSRLKKVKAEVEQFTTAELIEFGKWFAEHKWDAWDRQIEADSRAGKLDKLAEQARKDYAAGLCTEL